MSDQRPRGPVRRLTWDAVYPLPFESAWSIFAKVAAYNNLTIAEIGKLIAKRGYWKNLSVLNSQDSAWIDFAKFSVLLGVAEERLRQGFLDQLGFAFNGRDKCGTKRCHECEKVYYHCVFFDLSIFSECPVHHIALSRPCIYCPKSATFRVRDFSDKFFVRRCTGCKTELPRLDDLLSLPKLDDDTCALMANICSATAAWWELVGTEVGDLMLVLPQVSRLANEPSQMEAFWGACQLGRALRVVKGEHFFWRLSYDPIPSESARWRSVGATITKEQTYETRINDELGLYYKSLRRQIQKRFLKRHRKCCAILTTLGDCDIRSLAGDSVCPVSLAFVSWRMGIEAYLKVAGLRMAIKWHRLRLPAKFCGEMDIKSMLRYMYCEFLAIWQRIDGNRLESNIRICYSCGFDSNCSIFSAVSQPVGGAPEDGEVEFHVVYPDARVLVARSNEITCTARHKDDLLNIAHAMGLSRHALRDYSAPPMFVTRAPKFAFGRFIEIGV